MEFISDKAAELAKTKNSESISGISDLKFDHSHDFKLLRNSLVKNDGRLYLSFVESLRPRWKVVWKDISLGLILTFLGVASAKFLLTLSLPIFISLPILFLHSVWVGFFLAFISLFAHEAAHFNIHPNRKYNDLLAEIFICWWIYQPIERYRATHWTHHRLLGTSEDPEYTYNYKLNFEFLFNCISGLQVLKTYMNRSKKTLNVATTSKMMLSKHANRKYLTILALHLILNCMLLLAIYNFGGSLLVFMWLAGQYSLLPLFAATRQLLEHRGLNQNHLSRNFDHGLFSRFFGGAGFTEHLIHHWEPQISYTRTRELYRFLKHTQVSDILIKRKSTYFETFRVLWNQN